MADETGLAATPAVSEPVDETVNLDAPTIEPKAETETETTSEADTEDAGDAGDEDKPKKPSGAQRAKAREARLLNEIAERDRRLDDLERAQAAARAPSSEAPKEQDYADYFAWQRALTAHEAGKAVDDRLRARDDADRQARQASTNRERAETHAERVETAREVIADFDKVLGTMKDVNVRQEVIDEIMSSDNSAELAYHLAKNPEKLFAMDRMSGRELAREMGRLDVTVKLPTANKQTKAPAPLSAVKGGASAAFDPNTTDDMAAFSTWLLKDQAKRRGR